MARPMNGASQEQPCVVFDIGGTSLRAGLYSMNTRTILAQRTKPTPSLVTMANASAKEIQDSLLHEMDGMVEDLLCGEKPATLVAAFPGPVNERGYVLRCPTIWGDRDVQPFPAAKMLEERWPAARAFVLNDVTAAGYRFIEKGNEDLCIVTVSSGIGHKIFLDGRPRVGPGGRGGEIGHLRVDDSRFAPRCECGLVGHLGAVASGRGVLAAAQRRALQDTAAFADSWAGKKVCGAVDSLDNPLIVAAFLAGDAWAHSIVEEAAQPLGRALAALHLAVGVERFVLMGGFALALGNVYRALVARAASESTWSSGLAWDGMVELAHSHEPIGLLGAGRYAALQR